MRWSDKSTIVHSVGQQGLHELTQAKTGAHGIAKAVGKISRSTDGPDMCVPKVYEINWQCGVCDSDVLLVVHEHSAMVLCDCGPAKVLCDNSEINLENYHKVGGTN